MTKRNFLKQFIQEKKMVGSVLPSSRFLVKKMLKETEIEQAKVVVEFGPGTGIITNKILKRLAPDAHFIVFELNNDFFKLLQKKLNDPRVILINDTAQKLPHYLKENDLNDVQVIVSSLPLANFNTRMSYEIVKTSYECLSKGGIYVQFQYTLQAKKILLKCFSNAQIKIAALNVPPAFVYNCKKE